MDEREAERLNTDLLAILREAMPWAVEQIEESVRQGKPVAKQVRGRGDKATIATVELTGDLGKNQFVMTEDLTLTERLRITLDAVERLLIDPALMADDVRHKLLEVGVSEVDFAEPGEVGRHELGGRPASLSSQSWERISALLKRLRSDIANVR